MTETETTTMERVRSDYERLLSGGSDVAKLNPSKSWNMLVTISVGIVMTVIGYNYTWKYHKGKDGVMADEDNLCPNGAAWWLWICGICILVMQFIQELLITTLLNGERITLRVVQKSKGSFFYYLFAVTFIASIAIFIWGTVVVFGAWANWTDDFETFKANPVKMNFCERIPMMTAFAILFFYLGLTLWLAFFFACCCPGITCLFACCLPGWLIACFGNRDKGSESKTGDSDIRLQENP